MNTSLTLRRPDDWHLHLRDGAMLAAVAPHSADFGRAIIMPNLVPPVVTGAQASAYRDRITAALGQKVTLRPLMTLYLTESTDPADVVAAHAAGTISAVKLYPAGATTNSASGVRDFDKVRGVLDAMADRLEGYNSFAGAPDGADGSVKFVYKTAETVAAADTTAAETETVKEGNVFTRLWQRIVNLFKF